eukprot:GHRR01012425.1.p1 GENE.GHRR01012425.1~~GHRR01012425.1.p1  ORF type:complete len:369 (+),score=91.49 GHRR01012425.1:486-1592(+)
MLTSLLGRAEQAAAGHCSSTALLLSSIRAYTIGATTGATTTHEGGSQAQAKEIQAQLPPYVPNAEPVSIVHKLGISVLHDPWFNKGTAFSKAERERLGVRGLLPPRVTTLQLQEDRFMAEYEAELTMIPPEEIATGGVTSEMARRWQVLQHLQDRNETLFYKVLMENFVEMAPIIYTPTVGWVCSNYHKLYRRPRGMFFSAKDKGEMAALVYNWPQSDVHAVVVTDGSRILGLGDLGLNGLGIPVGKLDLYCAAAGFHPTKVLPCVVDVGTDNVALRSDPLYCGLTRPRLTGPAYYEILDEVCSPQSAGLTTSCLAGHYSNVCQPNVQRKYTLESRAPQALCEASCDLNAGTDSGHRRDCNEHPACLL